MEEAVRNRALLPSAALTALCEAVSYKLQATSFERLDIADGPFYYASKEILPTMTLVIGEKELSQLPVTIDPAVLSGAPVFRGTRVPVDALINNLEAGLTLDAFLENFPTVTREQAMQVLEFSKATLLKLRQTA